MDKETRKSIVIRRTGDTNLSVEFPEDITKDFDLVADATGEIPPEFLTAVLARAVAARAQLESGCGRVDGCGRDTIW